MTENERDEEKWHHPFCNYFQSERKGCRLCDRFYRDYPVVDCDDLMLHYFPDMVKRG